MNKKLLTRLIVIMGVVVLVIVFVIIRNISSPTQVKLDSDFLATRNEFDRVNFAPPVFIGEKLAINESLPTLEVVTTNHQQDLLQQLATMCRLVSSLQDTYYYGEQCNYFSFPDYIVVSMPEMLTESLETNTQTADVAAKQFLSELYGPNVNFTLVYQYVQTPSEVDEEADNDFYDAPTTLSANDSDLTKPTLVGFDSLLLRYVPTFENIAVGQMNHLSQNSINVTVDADSRVSAARLPTTWVEVTPTEKRYQSLTIDEALANIAHGDGYVTEATSLGASNRDNSNITGTNLWALNNIVFTDVALEYRIEDDQTRAIPCYHFSGTADDNLGYNLAVEIVTPAINFTKAR